MHPNLDLLQKLAQKIIRHVHGWNGTRVGGTTDPLLFDRINQSCYY